MENWLDNTRKLVNPEPKKNEVYEKKNKEVLKLESYRTLPGENFWKKFPKRELPESAKTRINVDNLEKLVIQQSDKMSDSELRRATRIISDLRKGADACQKGKLPALAAGNSESAYENGELLTDKLATWIKEGYVAGPFDCPPVSGFRCNPLIAVARNGKIRPVINMSGPKGKSFNDNLDKNKIEKVKMTTAKQFSYSLKESGVGARFSKFDIVDAYKLVPAKTCDFKLQGFTWLGKYFCETQQTFGAVPSVCNFDRLGNTVLTLVTSIGNVPKKNVSRTLDDFQGVGSRKGSYAEQFASTMEDVCRVLNVPLAPACPKKEKAFKLETCGTVLGTGFNSKNMTWFLTQEKVDKIVKRCLEGSSKSHMSLLQTQKLMGSINDLCQLNRFLRFYKTSGNSMISKFNNNENILLMTPEATKNGWRIVGRAALSALEGIPIASRRSFPPLSALNFYTDAAGAKYCKVNNVYKMVEEPERGVSCIGGESLEDIWVWSRLSWPKDFLAAKDERGVEFGRKSTTLESVGLLIPFLAFPEKVAGKHVIFHIDNKAVHYGWERGGVKNDAVASEVLRTVHVLASYLGCHVYVNHVLRISNEMADLADELSRRSVTKNVAWRKHLEEAVFKPTCSSFLESLIACTDNSICMEMLRALKLKCT